MNLRKILCIGMSFLLSLMCLVGCGKYLSEEEKEAIISKQIESVYNLEYEMDLIWNSYSDSDGLMEFYGYLDIYSDTYMASEETKEVIYIYETEIMNESNKIDKNKVDDVEFLEYLDNIDEYIFAVNNYAQAMEDGDGDKFSEAKEDIERYRKLITNYANKELSN